MDAKVGPVAIGYSCGGVASERTEHLLCAWSTGPFVLGSRRGSSLPGEGACWALYVILQEGEEALEAFRAIIVGVASTNFSNASVEIVSTGNHLNGNLVVGNRSICITTDVNSHSIINRPCEPVWEAIEFVGARVQPVICISSRFTRILSDVITTTLISGGTRITSLTSKGRNFSIGTRNRLGALS